MGTAALEKAGLDREQMAKRLALELQDGWLVNLGIGMPTKCLPYVPPERDVLFHSENGIIGMGPPPADPADADNDLLSAGKSPVTLVPGGCFIHHADSFAISRGGRLDATILGAYQVAENGDLANWMIPGKLVKGMGGAMDLVAGVKRVIVVMDHQNKAGESKVLKECTLPLTGKGVVDRIITNLGVLDVVEGGLKIVECADGVTEDELRAATQATIV